MAGVFDGVKNALNRTWTRAPDRAKNGLPALFHTSPRLDPVRVIAKSAASVAGKLYSKKVIRRDGDAADPIDDHELYLILENPCPSFPELDGWSLRYMTFAHIRLVGEFFWLKVRDQRGRIIALLPIPAAWVPRKPTVAEHTYLIYPYGVTAGAALTIPQEDVVWFKDVDLLDPYANGRGTTEAITDEIESDEYAAKYQKNFFFNDASPPYAILAPGGTEQTVKQIKQNFIQKLAGVLNARVPAVFTGKDIKIEKLGNTMVEVDMINSRKYFRDEVLQHYQIPPEIYGIVENSNRATIESAFYLFNKNVLSGDLAFFERVLTNQLCKEYDVDLCFKHDNIIQEDEEFALKVYQAGLASGVITENEFRTRFRLAEKPDGEVRIQGYSNMRVPVGSTAPEAEQATAASSAPEIPADTVLEIDDEPKQLKIADSPEVENRKKAIWQAFDRKAVSVEEPFRRAVKKISKAQSVRVRDAVKSAIRLSQTEGAIDKALDSVFTDESNRSVKQTLAPAWKVSLDAGHDHALEVIGGGKAYQGKADSPIYNAMFNAWIEKNGLKKAKEINKTTNESLRAKLAAELTESIKDGDGLGVMVDRLMTACDDVYKNMDTTRAELIARTESASTVNAGTWGTYKAEGVKRREWLSVRDDRTRSEANGDEFDHAVMDGVIIGIDEKYNVGGEMLEYPGDPSASAGNICNCRCAEAPVMGGGE